jgi:plasmid stabilization system protein ParE
MSFRVRFTREAKEDLRRLFEFLVERDIAAARRARKAIAKSIDFLSDFPWSCRKAIPDNPFMRELIIPFGSAGYVALFEIDDKGVTILAVRHQREDDFF